MNAFSFPSAFYIFWLFNSYFSTEQLYWRNPQFQPLLPLLCFHLSSQLLVLESKTTSPLEFTISQVLLVPGAILEFREKCWNSWRRSQLFFTWVFFPEPISTWDFSWEFGRIWYERWVLWDIKIWKVDELDEALYLFLNFLFVGFLQFS